MVPVPVDPRSPQGAHTRGAEGGTPQLVPWYGAGGGRRDAEVGPTLRCPTGSPAQGREEEAEEEEEAAGGTAGPPRWLCPLEGKRGPHKRGGAAAPARQPWRPPPALAALLLLWLEMAGGRGGLLGRAAACSPSGRRPPASGRCPQEEGGLWDVQDACPGWPPYHPWRCSPARRGVRPSQKVGMGSV